MLHLALRLAVTGIIVKEDDVRFVAQTALGRDVPSGSVLLPQATTFERSPLTTVDNDGQAHFTVTATGASVPLIDSAALRRMIRAQTITVARLRLQSALPLAEGATAPAAPATAPAAAPQPAARAAGWEDTAKRWP